MSIRYHEAGILLNCYIAHKLMRTETIYDILSQCQREDAANFKENFIRKVLCMTVLTAYNNKTYRIDDVDFQKTPLRKHIETNILHYYEEVKYDN